MIPHGRVPSQRSIAHPSASRDTDRDHQFDADAQPEPQALLRGRTVTDRWLTSNILRTRPVDPFAEPRQRIRRLALAHLGKRRTAAERRRNIMTPRNPVNEPPGLR